MRGSLQIQETQMTPLITRSFRKCTFGLIMFEKAVKATNPLFTIEAVHESVFALVHPGEGQTRMV